LRKRPHFRRKPIPNCGSNYRESALLHSSSAFERNRDVTTGGRAKRAVRRWSRGKSAELAQIVGGTAMLTLPDNGGNTVDNALREW